MAFRVLVTGANKGIGRAIAAALLAATHPRPLRLIVAARDPDRGAAAVQALAAGPIAGDNSVHLLALDVASDASVAHALAEYRRSEGESLDVLVNNAGTAAKGDAWSETIARDTANVNYLGARRVTEAFLPLLRNTPGARIVNISSSAAALSRLSPALRQRFLDPELTRDALDALLDSFYRAITDGSYADQGWPRNTYSVSKMALNAYARILAREEAGRVAVHSCCPGWVRTDMAGPRAALSVEQGAVTPVHLVCDASVAAAPSGSFWKDKTPQPAGAF